MHIHCIGFAGNDTLSIAGALFKNEGFQLGSTTDKTVNKKNINLEKYELSASLQEWDPEKIDIGIDAVIVGTKIETSNPEVLKARDLDIPIFSPPEFLHEHAKYKTRVVIGGAHRITMIIKLIIEILEYHAKDVDYVVGQTNGEIKLKLTQKNDFIIFEDDTYLSYKDKVTFHVYRPNIALLTGIGAGEGEANKFFIDSIVKGGILVYNEEDVELEEKANQSTNTIRKHPYRTPPYKMENGTIFLETPEGDLPMEFFDEATVKHIAGAKWICQHLGVDEDDFYEAIGSLAIG